MEIDARAIRAFFSVAPQVVEPPVASGKVIAVCRKGRHHDEQVEPLLRRAMPFRRHGPMVIAGRCGEAEPGTAHTILRSVTVGGLPWPHGARNSWSQAQAQTQASLGSAEANNPTPGRCFVVRGLLL